MAVTTRTESAGLRIGISVGSDKVTAAKPTQVYRIVLEKDQEGRVVATSPDLQGVVTDGKDENEALTNAVEAVQAMLDSMKVEKDFILIPSHKMSV